MITRSSRWSSRDWPRCDPRHRRCSSPRRQPPIPWRWTTFSWAWFWWSPDRSPGLGDASPGESILRIIPLTPSSSTYCWSSSMTPADWLITPLTSTMAILSPKANGSMSLRHNVRQEKGRQKRKMSSTNNHNPTQLRILFVSWNPSTRNSYWVNKLLSYWSLSYLSKNV